MKNLETVKKPVAPPHDFYGGVEAMHIRGYGVVKHLCDGI